MPGKVMQVCEASQLEHLTKQGWALEEVLPETVIVRVTHQEQRLRNDSNTYYATDLLDMDRSMPTTVNRYLLSKSGETALSETQAALDKLQQEQHALGRMVQDLTRERDLALRDKAAVEVVLTQSRETVGSYIKSLSDVTRLKTKLEGDIGKIRQDIGESAMRKILDAQ